jgi:hypothetical protein
MVVEDDDYDYPTNALHLRDKEWERFCQDSVQSVPLFRLKNNKRVAKSHLVHHWSSIPDSEVELEAASSGDIDMEVEEASDRVVQGSGLR